MIAAQHGLMAAKEAGSRPAQEHFLPSVQVTPKLRENGELTILGSATTPVKNHIVLSVVKAVRRAVHGRGQTQIHTSPIQIPPPIQRKRRPVQFSRTHGPLPVVRPILHRQLLQSSRPGKTPLAREPNPQIPLQTMSTLPASLIDRVARPKAVRPLRDDRPNRPNRPVACPLNQHPPNRHVAHPPVPRPLL